MLVHAPTGKIINDSIMSNIKLLIIFCRIIISYISQVYINVFIYNKFGNNDFNKRIKMRKFPHLLLFNTLYLLSYLYLAHGGRFYSPFPRTPATIPIINTAAQTKRPNARKLNPVPVFVKTFVNDVLSTDIVSDGSSSACLQQLQVLPSS